jgi:hypothetical protein
MSELVHRRVHVFLQSLKAPCLSRAETRNMKSKGQSVEDEMRCDGHGIISIKMVFSIMNKRLQEATSTFYGQLSIITCCCAPI